MKRKTAFASMIAALLIAALPATPAVAGNASVDTVTPGIWTGYSESFYGGLAVDLLHSTTCTSHLPVIQSAKNGADSGATLYLYSAPGCSVVNLIAIIPPGHEMPLMLSPDAARSVPTS